MRATRTKHYLTGDGWTDAVAGFFTSLILYGFVHWGVMNVLYYLIPRRVDFFSRVVSDCVIVSLVSFVVWSGMRLHYHLPLANSVLFGSLSLCGIYLYVFQPV